MSENKEDTLLGKTVMFTDELKLRTPIQVWHPDILLRLKDFCASPNLFAEGEISSGYVRDMLRDARDEIKRLRLAIHRLADQDATLSMCEGSVTVTMDATLTGDETDLLLWLSSAGDEERIASKTITPAAREMLRGLLRRGGNHG